MFGSILKRVRDLTLCSLIFGSATYGYIYYLSKKNEKEYLEAIQSDTIKDASRLTNQSFGISWGFQADDTIMSRIDSGDLLFIRYQCEQCLSPQTMLTCYLQNSFFLEQEFHSVGCTFRDQTGLYVFYNEFGQTKVRNYCQLVSLPYIKALTLQKRSKDLAKVHLNLRKIIDFDKSIEESSAQFINRINKLLGGKRQLYKVEDLLSGQQKINIRTETNNTLRSL